MLPASERRAAVSASRLYQGNRGSDRRRRSSICSTSSNVLVEVAASPSDRSAPEIADLRRRIESGSLLFKASAGVSMRERRKASAQQIEPAFVTLISCRGTFMTTRLVTIVAATLAAGRPSRRTARSPAPPRRMAQWPQRWAARRGAWADRARMRTGPARHRTRSARSREARADRQRDQGSLFDQAYSQMDSGRDRAVDRFSRTRHEGLRADASIGRLTRRPGRPARRGAGDDCGARGPIRPART